MQVIVEAMAIGRPIVASADGSASDFVRDGITGFLCPAGDVEAFTARVLELLRDAGLRERMASAARRAYEEDLTWASVYRRYWDAFASASTLAAEHSRRTLNAGRDN